MSIFDSIARMFSPQKAAPATPAATGYGAVYQNKWSTPPIRNAALWQEYYHKNPRANPIHIISRDIARANYRVIRKGDEEATNLTEHPLNKILTTPCSDRSIDAFMLFYCTSAYMELPGGECFWVVERAANGEPLMVWITPPSWVQETPSMGKPYFTVTNSTGASGTSKQVPATDVVWFKEPNISNPYGRGRGRAEAIGNEMESDEYAAKYQKNFFFNDAMPPYIMFLPGTSEDELIRFKEDFLSKQQGATKNRRPSFINTEGKIERMSDTPKEIDFNESRKVIRDMVNEHWGVPPEIMGIIENSNRATIDSADYLYKKNVIAPRLERIGDVVNRQFVPMFKDNAVLFMFDNMVLADKEFYLRQSSEGLSRGALTMNEWRKMNELPALDNGDVLYMPFTTMVTDPADLGPTPPPDAAPVAASSAPDVEKDAGDCAHNTADKGTDNSAGSAEDKAEPAAVVERKSSFSEEQKTVAWKAFDRRAALIENNNKSITRKVAAKQQKELTALIKDQIKGMKADELDEAAKKARLARILEDYYTTQKAMEFTAAKTPVWELAMRAGVDHAYSVMQLSAPDMELYNPKFSEWVSEHGLGMCRSINDTSKDAVKASLTQGIENGESIDQLTDRIGEVYNGLETYRAETIARTETIGTVNHGSYLGYAEEGVRSKEWLSTRDDRTRESHVDIDGEVVGIDEEFSNGCSYPGDPMGAPEEVINCRCTILPVID